MFPTLAMRESLIQRIAARLLGELEQVGGRGRTPRKGRRREQHTGAGARNDMRGWDGTTHGVGIGMGYDTQG